MNSTMVWVITAMLWYQGPGDYGHTDYEAKQFKGRGECLDSVSYTHLTLPTTEYV